VLIRSVENTFAGLLLLVWLPLLALHSILAKADAPRRDLARRTRSGSRRHPLPILQSAGVPGFDRALEAYEELIDATLAGRRI
jgi:hypothetical protein